MPLSAAISVVASSGDRCKPSRPIMPHSTRSRSADGPLGVGQRRKKEIKMINTLNEGEEKKPYGVASAASLDMRSVSLSDTNWRQSDI